MSTTIYDEDKDLDSHEHTAGSHDDLGITEDDRQREIDELEDFWNSGDSETDPLSSEGLSRAEEDESSREDSGDDIDDQESDELQKATGEDANNDLFKPGRKNGFNFRGKGARGTFIGIGVGGLAFSIVFGFFMYMTVYRSEHLRNLLWDYRFARFHYQMNKRVKAIIASSESPNALNATLDESLKKTTIYEKIRGYSPEKALNNLGFGDDGIGLEIEKTGTVGFRENRIISYLDPDSGERIYSERASNIPDGARVVNTAEFASGLTTAAENHLNSMEHSKFFQKQTRKLLNSKVGIKFGDRFKNYADNLRKRAVDPNNPTDAERTSALAETDANVSRGSPDARTASGSLEEASEQANQEINDGVGPPDERILDGGGEDLPVIDVDSPQNHVNWANSKTRASLLKGASVYTKISSGVFVATTACMVRDINSSINTALRTRIEGPMRMIANQFGEAEQLKSNNNVQMDVLEERQEQYDGFEESAAGMRLTGTKEEDIPEGAKMEAADLPFQFFGIDLSTIATFSSVVDDMLNKIATQAVLPIPGITFIPGTDRVGKEVLDETCKILMNPKVQLGLAVVDVIVAAITIGSSKAVSEAIVKAFQIGISVARGVGFQKIFFEYLLPKVLFSLAGSSGMLFSGDIQNGNKMDIGAMMLSSQTAKASGGSPISFGQASRDQAEAMALVKKQKQNEFGNLASFNPKNPYSITSQFALSLPAKPAEAIGSVLSKSFGSIFNTRGITSFGSLFSGSALAASENIYYENYGMPVYGISDEYITKDFAENAVAVDGTPGKLQQLLQKYQACFTSSLADEVMGGGFGTDLPDQSICGDEEARQLGLYIIDNCAMGYISEGVTPNNCSLLAGAGDVVAYSEFSTSTSGYATLFDGVDNSLQNFAGGY